MKAALLFTYLDVCTTILNREPGGRFGFSVSQERNCEIDGITKGSPADKSELQVGDVIISINYQKATTTKEVVEIMRGTGDSLEIKYCKKGKHEKCTILFLIAVI